MNKKLYKIEEGKMIDGVCGGIAEYFNVDATVIRLAWVLLTLCTAGTAGIIGYIVGAIIMPRKPEAIESAD